MSDARYVVLTFPKAQPEPDFGLEPDLSLGANPLEELGDDPAADPPPVTFQLSVMPQADAKALADKDDSVVIHAGLPLELIEPTDSKDAAPAAATPWGLAAVGALASRRTGAGVAVAVLDTGCDVEHEAFTRLRTEKRIVVRNFTTEGAGENDVTDTNGHGTHCAGTVCGESVAGQRIGVAPGIDKLIIAKILGKGGGSTDVITNAILWAVQQGAKVISMSLGTNFPGWVEVIAAQQKMTVRKATSAALKTYREVILQLGKLGAFLSSRGVLVIAASGNESERPNFTLDKAPPSASETFISVAAVSQDGVVARFSNTGADIAGPGVDVVSAKAGGGLSTKSGTSMATPHVAGVAALWYEELSGWKSPADAVRNRLLGRAMPLAGQSPDDVGGGLVQAPPPPPPPA